MATLIDMLFFVQFMGALICIGFPLYNIMSWSKPLFDLKVNFLFFIGYVICFFLSLTCVLIDPEKLIYHPILTLESWMILIEVVFLFIAIFRYLENIDEQNGPVRTLK